jgi:hypothetical protein
MALAAAKAAADSALRLATATMRTAALAATSRVNWRAMLAPPRMPIRSGVPGAGEGLACHRPQPAQLEVQADCEQQEQGAVDRAQARRFGVGKQRLAQGQARQGFGEAGDHVEQHGDRVTDDLHMPRPATERSRDHRGGADGQGQDRQDRQGMRRPEAAMLEDAQAGDGGEQGGHQVGASQRVVGRDFLVTRQGPEAAEDGDQADGGVDHSERCQAEHLDLLESLGLVPALLSRIQACAPSLDRP